MKAVFVSYRRSDSSDITGRIFDRLKAAFGEEMLFKDVDSIDLGDDFRATITQAVGECKVLLAIIGRDWVTAADPAGRRRLDSPDDFVRLEIAAALTRGIPVIPILVENATVPSSDQLPEPLKELAFRNGMPVRPDPDFRTDMARLLRQLKKRVGGGRRGRFRLPAGVRQRPWVVWGLAALAVLLLGLGLWRWAWPPEDVPQGPGTPEAAPGTSPAGEVAAPQPIRYWIKDLPPVPGADPAKLFSNALGSWQAVVPTPLRRADSEADANVIVGTDPRYTAVTFGLGPPKAGQGPILVRFSPTVDWTPRTFEAVCGRMIGHVLGLGVSDTPGQMMTREANPETTPLTPQGEDIRRAREIWDKR